MSGKKGNIRRLHMGEFEHYKKGRRGLEKQTHTEKGKWDVREIRIP